MRNLILIRHANSQPTPDLLARDWPLSESGRSRCQLLTDRLKASALDRVVTSTEPKASETGQILAAQLGLPSETAPDLHEHDRTNVTTWHNSAEFQAIIADLFARPQELVYGRETAEACHDRFAQAVRNVVNAYPAQTLAIVSHATVMSLFVARLAGFEPFLFWQQLGMPAYVVLNLPDWRVIETVASLD